MATTTKKTTATKKIKINGTIVSDNNTFIYRWLGLQATSPQMVADELEAAGGEPVEIYINSYGGSVPAGSEIYTMIREYEGETISKITGFACSAASFIALATDKTLISPTGQIMIHNAIAGAQGNRHALTSGAQMLESVDEGIAHAYTLKTGRSKEELMSYMDKETFFNAQKAVELGLADEIMFSETDNGPDISNNASAFVELPQAVIDKVRNELLKDNGQEGLVTQKNQTKEKASSVTESQSEGEDSVKDLAELQAKYPDIYNAAVQAGEMKERTRITDLNALAKAPGAAEIVAQAIAEGKTAGETAMAIVRASAERVKNEGEQRREDSQASGVHEIPSDKAPEKKNKDDEIQAEADALFAEVQKMTGGKR